MMMGGGETTPEKSMRRTTIFALQMVLWSTFLVAFTLRFSQEWKMTSSMLASIRNAQVAGVRSPAMDSKKEEKDSGSFQEELEEEHEQIAVSVQEIQRSLESKLTQKDAAALNELLQKLNQVQKESERKAKEESAAIEELYRVVSPERLANIVKDHRSHYKEASPFPHIAIDGLFPDAILQKVIAEHPESSLGDNGCLTVKQAGCFTQKTQNLKSSIANEENMGMHTRILFSFLKSSIFTHFLEELTGIDNIIPDPHFRGSGLHFTAPGGNLDVHADFNKYRAYNLDRRVNSFIYLNNDWLDEYGGHLDLWSRDMKTCHERIAPKLGRFVVFSSTDFSYHGHPEPIAAPQGRARRSMALYYYTNGRPESECLRNDCTGNDHSTLFQKPVGCTKCLDDTCRRETTLNPPTWMVQ